MSIFNCVFTKYFHPCISIFNWVFSKTFFVLLLLYQSSNGFSQKTFILIYQPSIWFSQKTFIVLFLLYQYSIGFSQVFHCSSLFIPIYNCIFKRTFILFPPPLYTSSTVFFKKLSAFLTQSNLSNDRASTDSFTNFRKVDCHRFPLTFPDSYISNFLYALKIDCGRFNNY